ncbi:hypothetical protein K504DRAFT_468708 [Pleomassaria siparia CBS 279.74]|uniref:Uncharacterized protein n=1 Tax=Pleomassaria siparia CBS 279.74 TaxID=1314801 RepID=A0A6G1K6W3_9PLEO|nr:hypothetical protein K504DRAFT_468708 [Pleomassaria siparia CBS 279.74]
MDGRLLIHLILLDPRPSTCKATYLPTYLPTYPPTYPPIHLSTYLPYPTLPLQSWAVPQREEKVKEQASRP